jgi:hypothetical protein
VRKTAVKQRKNSQGFPASALAASYVFGVLERRGVLRHSGVA